MWTYIRPFGRQLTKKMCTGPSRFNSDIEAFRSILSKAHHVVVLTGAGISAESGIPTFRGPGGFWRKYNAQDLATPSAFNYDPGLVWEFYHYRREMVRRAQPNPAHIFLAVAENNYKNAGRTFTVITQNIDGLHAKSGSENVIELHGNLYKTRCLKCADVRENHDSPICPALLGRGSPNLDPEKYIPIPARDLPHCMVTNSSSGNRPCGGLLRPHVVWFGESLNYEVTRQAQDVMDQADACLVVGTSAVVYPAAGYAPALAARGVPVAEINLEVTPTTHSLGFHFSGKSGEVIPKLFDALALT